MTDFTGGQSSGARGHAGSGGPAERDLRTMQEMYDAAWWSGHFGELDGLQAERGYEHYEAAIRYGWESAHRHVGRRWDEVEDEIARGWEERRGNTNPAWDEASDAVRHAFDRGIESLARDR